MRSKRAGSEWEETMDLPVEQLSQMTGEQEHQFWEQFAHDLDNDSGEAAEAHMKAGRPIYYEDPDYPDQVVKQYPDGRRQLVRFQRPSGEEVVLEDL
jgi:hypothetical protein